MRFSGVFLSHKAHAGDLCTATGIILSPLSLTDMWLMRQSEHVTIGQEPGQEVNLTLKLPIPAYIYHNRKTNGLNSCVSIGFSLPDVIYTSTAGSGWIQNVKCKASCESVMSHSLVKASSGFLEMWSVLYLGVTINLYHSIRHAWMNWQCWILYSTMEHILFSEG